MADQSPGIVYSDHDLTVLAADAIQRAQDTRAAGKAEWTFHERRVAVYLELLMFRGMATGAARVEVAKKITETVKCRTRVVTLETQERK